MSNARLYAVTFVVSLAQLTTGMFLGWTSPMIPKLMSEDSSMKMTTDEASWTVSLLNLGMSLGCFLSVFLVDLAGRKMTILFAIVPTVASWALMAWDSSIVSLYVARFTGGIGSGLVFTAGSMYVTEIAPPEIRGALGSCFMIMDYCGSLLGYIIGSFVTTAEYAYAAMGMAMVQFVIFIWFHETPYYLLRRKHLVDAMDSLIFLRGSKGVAEEMDLIMRSVECEPKNTGVFSVVLDLISKAGGWRAILIGVCLMTIQAFSGSIILVAYAQTIFENIHDLRKQECYMSIILAAVQLITYLLCISYVDRIGRKPLIIASIIGVTICSFILGVYFCIKDNGGDSEGLQWMAFASVLLYSASVSLGLTSVPFVIMNEIFPMYAKSTCISLCFCINFLWSFIMVKVWSIVAFGLNIFTAFWIISALNVFGILFLVHYLPETKSISLMRIQEKLVYRTKT